MSISTGGGDKGQTSLWSGERVDKDDARVEAYGTIDELSSFLGEAKHYVKSYKVKDIIHKVQDNLFRVAGELASESKLFVQPITKEDVDEITKLVHYFEDAVQLKGFVIPGTTIQSAKLDICRTIARRAERRIITLSKKNKVNEYLIKYVNRLSDLLFIMARFEEYIEDKIEYKKW
ncbi:ATP--cobalamin adenosyltransferase [Marinitoga sp. 1135]|uniref:Corrinoid adenosyltransferase n=1 Tax=Marinitoga piezophila (strain DSM 14283 / JCM 11233 / KA3) TaxID=443254 RepID=H2J581_MARPK|nr:MULTISPECIES: cob(I)yrinic acid a,c-diamide adenosyltransferase [Marinitoga]AEX84939.1 ATP:cob(I)alamin adenosyltransferase [Marinitoga piezophila KA3]APT75446.1 ATP--cobalamin adenosyltransferase [Marinitoga sp. 1137]NUU95172.1 ATP--cobalamin adenosyltransferase [Marinitoga sp. 1135]NUU97104.1 ATP--cobalamin adenosyltransferase [Marinitoga sp. 1138]